MAFTPETGTGVADANAYIDIATFRDHHTDRGRDTVEHLDPEVQAAIIQASDYVDKRFGRRFRGDRLRGEDQGLEWPRIDAYSDDGFSLLGVPKALRKAIAEYALLALQLGRDLAPPTPPDFGVLDPVTGEVTNTSSGKIIEKTEEVGPIKDSTRYADGNSTGRPMVGTGNLIQRIPEYPQADLWIEELLCSYSARELDRG